MPPSEARQDSGSIKLGTANKNSKARQQLPLVKYTDLNTCVVDLELVGNIELSGEKTSTEFAFF